MQTLIISKAQVKQLLSMTELTHGIKNAYINYSRNKSIIPTRSVSKIDCSSIVINFPGVLEDYSAYTIKINVKTSTNPLAGLPFLMGTILLIDRNTGRLLAIFESSLITAMRTGAAGAIGVTTLVKANTGKAALIGAGVQGEWQLRALYAVGYLQEVYVYDQIPEKASLLAYKLQVELNIPFHVVDSIEQATCMSDVLLVTTQSHSPIITNSMLRPGIHINAFGADQPGKVELSTGVIKESLVITDDTRLAFTDGALNVPYTENQITDDIVFCEIGEILSGNICVTEDKPTIFANVGLAFQDTVACRLIYNQALKLNVGTMVDIESIGNICTSEFS